MRPEFFIIDLTRNMNDVSEEIIQLLDFHSRENRMTVKDIKINIINEEKALVCILAE